MERLPRHLEQSYGKVLTLWQTDFGFRGAFLRALANLPYSAFRWEMPPLTRETLGQPFAFVALDSPWLERDSDPLAFVRYAPEQQQHAFLALIGKTVEAQLSDQPLWLSTAGAGVAWLHVRLDKRPKYYGYVPYTSPPPA